MSLFEWSSTPERRAGNRDLPIVPNEIYLIIFEHIAPPSGELSAEQLKTFSDLSLVCKLFGDISLPRIFERVELCGWMSHCGAALRGTALCQQVAAKEPLALSLAQCVKVCHITHWEVYPLASCELSQMYTTGMAHMKNIRELKFIRSFINQGHWDVITVLESLEELSFDTCSFLDGPADLDPDKRAKVKVPYLQVLRCAGLLQPLKAVDPWHLHTLITGLRFDNRTNWRAETLPIDLRVSIENRLHPLDMFRDLVKRVLRGTSFSIQVLRLPIYICSDLGKLFEDPAWRNMPHLRSLTLDQESWATYTSYTAVVPLICDGVRVHRSLQSFTIGSHFYYPLSHEDRHMVREKLSDMPALNFVEIHQSIIQVDGKWVNIQGGDL
ncbi:hypothetical protein BS17DRAFT_810556 [Gyrodon lividus]|nr:hypothetical protein BS17DRAFT_810556 [Gyrodon lividus]